MTVVTRASFVRLATKEGLSPLSHSQTRIASFSSPAAVIGIKGTDFIVYVKRKEASEFIGVDGLIEAASRSRPDYSLRIGKRQWGEIVEGQKPRPPIHVPDELWNPAMEEFRFPTQEEVRAAERRGQ